MKYEVSFLGGKPGLAAEGKGHRARVGGRPLADNSPRRSAALQGFCLPGKTVLPNG